MTFEDKVFRTYSFLRAQVPASRADDILRELAFTYYLYKKYDSENNYDDLVSLSNGVAIKLVDPIGPFANDTIKRLARGSYTEAQLIDAISKGKEDYAMCVNGGFYREMDMKGIHLMLLNFSEDELLRLLNMSFENSVREDSTPEPVTDLVLKLSNNYLKNHRRVTDMGCGTGSFLVAANKMFVEKEGVEISNDNFNIARMRMFANEINANIRLANCFEDSWHHQTGQKKSDLVFSEFPWKQIIKDSGQKEMMVNCNANRFLLTNSSSTDYYYLSAMMNYLTRDGVAIAVVPLSSLSNLNDKEARKYIIERGFLREVISLPTNIFSRTSISTALVVLGLEPVDKVSFFDGRDYFIQKNRAVNTIDVDRLLHDLAEAKENGVSYVSKEEMEKRDYSFSPSHYQKSVEKSLPNATELIELADVFTGWQVPSAKLEAIHKTDGTGVRLLQMSNVENGSIVSKLEKYDIPENTVQKFKVQKGDVVISTKSLKVKSAVVDLNLDEPIVAAGSIMVIRPKDKELDPYYLVAYFESDLGKQVLNMYQTGVVIPNLSINNVKKMPVPRLSYPRQEQLGNAYRDLRDLIQSEKERLKALEQRVNKMLDNLWNEDKGE